jgi:hypothetical protein
VANIQQTNNIESNLLNRNIPSNTVTHKCSCKVVDTDILLLTAISKFFFSSNPINVAAGA